MARPTTRFRSSFLAHGGVRLRRGVWTPLERFGVEECPTCGKVPRVRWGADDETTTDVELVCSPGCAVDVIVGPEYGLEDVLRVCAELLAARHIYLDLQDLALGDATPHVVERLAGLKGELDRRVAAGRGGA